MGWKLNLKEVEILLEASQFHNVVKIFLFAKIKDAPLSNYSLKSTDKKTNMENQFWAVACGLGWPVE